MKAELVRFMIAMRSYIRKHPGKASILRKAVGDAFGQIGPNSRYRDTILYLHLSERTEYSTSSLLSNVINSFKQRKGSLDTAIALCYLALTDETYISLIPGIEKALFGKARGFNEIVGWETPTAPRVSTPTGALNPPAPNAPTLRLRPPGRHSHPFHFSNRPTSLIGRENEFAALKEFVNPTPGFKWMQIAGGGGQGKSRLALELVLHVGNDWDAGFLHKHDLEEFQLDESGYSATRWREWRPIRPTLIVVDYVVGHEDEIGFALDQLADRTPDFSMAVRVLLLERTPWFLEEQSGLDTSAMHQPRKGAVSEWFAKMNGRDASGGIRRNDLSSSEFAHASGVIGLNDLQSHDLIKVVQSRVSKAANTIPPSAESVESYLGACFLPSRPLFALFLADSLLQGELRIDWTVSSVLEHAFEQHCLKLWDRSWGNCPTLASEHPAIKLAVLATLCGSVDSRYLPRSFLGCDDQETVRRQALGLTGGFARGGRVGVGSVISALEPDILGEWFVLSFLEQSYNRQEVVEMACKNPWSDIGLFINRAVDDFPGNSSTARILDYNPPHPRLKRMFGEAATELGTNYLIGNSVEYDLDLACKWLSKGAEAGVKRAMYHLGLLFGSDGPKENPGLAVDWLRTAAEAGHPLAMHNLGYCYHHSYGVYENPDKAFTWYMRSAESGNELIWFAIARCYEDGYGCEKNTSLAADWYLKAATAGDCMAMTNLAHLYCLGSGVEQDYASQFAWTERAAEAGHSPAMYNLGVCYERGYGVHQDPDKATLWFDRARDAGLHLPE